MKKYLLKTKSLLLSATAKDTYVLFIGNSISALLSFFYTILVARNLSVESFGVFSAVNNLVVIISSITDFGVSAGLVNYVSESIQRHKRSKEYEFIKAVLVFKFLFSLFFLTLVIFFRKIVSFKFLASENEWTALWVGLISFTLSLFAIFPSVLQARRKFLKSAIIDNIFYLLRLIFVFVFLFLPFWYLLDRLFLAYFLSGLIGIFIGFVFIGFSFFYTKPSLPIYKKLISFSGWLGINKILSSFFGRLDLQMLAYLMGANKTGVYSVASRLGGFITILVSSFSSVLAPRFAAFEDKNSQRRYLLKSTLAILPISFGLFLWIIVAKPFIIFLFGEKYLESVRVFQVLILAMIPFLFTVPSVTAIIYALKKPFYIGYFSIFQSILLFVLNYIFIKRWGVFGPPIALGLVNMILVFYSWVIVFRHYFIGK